MTEDNVSDWRRELVDADEVPSERREQARRLLTEMRRPQIELQLPIDVVLEDGPRAEAAHAV